MEPPMERVTANVYSNTRIRGSNPSYVTTSDGVVVIDTPQLPTRAVAMRAEAESHGPIRYLINTEHHVDHIFGNYFFKGAGTRRQPQGPVGQLHGRRRRSSTPSRTRRRRSRPTIPRGRRSSPTAMSTRPTRTRARSSSPATSRSPWATTRSAASTRPATRPASSRCTSPRSASSSPGTRSSTSVRPGSCRPTSTAGSRPSSGSGRSTSTTWFPGTAP